MRSPSRSLLCLTALASIGAAAVALLVGDPGDGEGGAPPEEVREAARDVANSERAPQVVVLESQRSSASDTAVPTWAPDELLIRPTADLDALAAAAGAEVIEPVGRSGFAVLRVPAGETPDSLLAWLRGEGLVSFGAPQGLTRGAGLRAIEAVQWGLATSDMPKGKAKSMGSVTVAILDTGVAYEDHEDPDGTRYLAAPSLTGSAVVAPWDFVSDDAHPNDDHQHGTHIASIIASSGDIDGVAPGVALMPLKVLDADNMGTEYDLIEAIFHATDHGADVINLSLTFGQGYVPSQGLLEAIDHAADAGVVLVGATGNEGADEVSWPAASPRVVAVGAHCPNSGKGYEAAGYTNIGPAMDLTAPGGCMGRDWWGSDGVPDGIVGATFALNQPDAPGYWLMAGTSQAAAFTTGAVARMIAAGADPAHAALFLQDSAVRWSGHHGFPAGLGAGRLQVAGAVNAGLSGLASGSRTDQRVDVALTPYLVDNGDGTVTPTARVTAVDADGARMNNAEVVAQLHGPGGQRVSCTLRRNSDGTCELAGVPVAAHTPDGQPAALAWRFVVSAVVENKNYAYRPGSLLFASDTLEAVVGELRNDAALRDAVLGFYWSDGPVEALGEVDEALVVLDSGAGISTSPFGILATPPALSTVGDVSMATMDGAGITTSPFGVRIVQIDAGLTGSGITTSPFGIVAFDAVDMLGGAGISTSPFGIADVTSPSEDLCLDGCGTFFNDPMRLSTGDILAPAEVDVSGTALQAQLSEGGWTTPDGTSAASTLSTQESLHLRALADGAGLNGDAVEVAVPGKR